MPTNNINISNSPINSFSKRKGSNVELQTHRSLTKHNNSKKANTNLELDIFLKNYSHDIDLRKFSESEIKPKFKLSEKINFFSPLIKHNKQVKDVAKSLTGKNQSNNDNPKVKMASVHNKIAMFLDKLSLKKTDNKKNNVNKNSHIYSLKKRDKQV